MRTRRCGDPLGLGLMAYPLFPFMLPLLLLLLLLLRLLLYPLFLPPAPTALPPPEMVALTLESLRRGG